MHLVSIVMKHMRSSGTRWVWGNCRAGLTTAGCTMGGAPHCQWVPRSNHAVFDVQFKHLFALRKSRLRVWEKGPALRWYGDPRMVNPALGSCPLLCPTPSYLSAWPGEVAGLPYPKLKALKKLLHFMWWKQCLEKQKHEIVHYSICRSVISLTVNVSMRPSWHHLSNDSINI